MQPVHRNDRGSCITLHSRIERNPHWCLDADPVKCVCHSDWLLHNWMNLHSVHHFGLSCWRGRHENSFVICQQHHCGCEMNWFFLSYIVCPESMGTVAFVVSEWFKMHHLTYTTQIGESIWGCVIWEIKVCYSSVPQTFDIYYFSVKLCDEFSQYICIVFFSTCFSLKL